MTRAKPKHLHKRPGRAPMPLEARKRWTLSEIQSRCRVTLSGCWEWICSAAASEHERCSKQIEHAGQCMGVRRVSYLLMYGSLPNDGRQIVPAKCMNPRCMNPAHARALTVKEKVAIAIKRGTFVTPERTRHMAKAKQEKFGKLAEGMKTAREIRQIKGPAREHAPKYGISASLFNRIRRGEAWKEQ